MLKDLLHAILNTTQQTMASPESFNSQIGVPLSLLSIRRNDRIAIIEAGISLEGEMNQLAKIIAPDCSILTNIGQNHLNTLKRCLLSLRKKIKLLATSFSTLVAFANDSHLTPYTPQLSQKVYYWNQETALLQSLTIYPVKMHRECLIALNFPMETHLKA